MLDRHIDAAARPAVLEIRNLTTSFGPQERPLVAVDGLSLSLKAGEIHGLVGESGSGKSITLRSILGLIQPRGRVGGEILWKGRNLAALSERELGAIRGKEIAMIFQEPMTSLNPLLPVGLQITENLAAHTGLARAEREREAVALLDRVGIPGARARLADFPHEFSGGMRQRVMIAIALASRPQLLLADEPTTALDVTIQDQILRLLQSLAAEFGMSVILVTHDMGVVAACCDRVSVMYGGRLCESGPTADVIAAPRHPYTRGLLHSIPRGVAPRTPLYSIPGVPPGLGERPPGCAFAPRCPNALDVCRDEKPVPSVSAGGRGLACHNPEPGPTEETR
ncbi:ABC transporter ATP-binding protein [Gellertiella hungarica]|uniref:Oligopeptide transport system ATP-binding protein n=1 Tax=Gellertiella hungarica TaxID=1572859 RepID=A0A7W6J154_9HYPH|nr:ABC transporter ATP-binding protein [Gellertiella hungarica]MBB4062861.1 oligopeptide transport system ATP-binding protein [Gellertiella hungarica]